MYIYALNTPSDHGMTDQTSEWCENDEVKGWVVECGAPDPLSLCSMPTETDVGWWFRRSAHRCLISSPSCPVDGSLVCCLRCCPRPRWFPPPQKPRLVAGAPRSLFYLLWLRFLSSICPLSLTFLLWCEERQGYFRRTFRCIEFTSGLCVLWRSCKSDVPFIFDLKINIASSTQKSCLVCPSKRIPTRGYVWQTL